MPGHPHSSPRSPLTDLTRPLCLEAQAASPEVREREHKSIIHQIQRAYPPDEHWG